MGINIEWGADVRVLALISKYKTKIGIYKKRFFFLNHEKHFLNNYHL